MWRKLRWTLLAIAYVLFMAGIFIILTTPARSQPQNCVPLEQVEELLKAWDETLRDSGTLGGLTIRLYVNAETRAWTLFWFYPDDDERGGQACIIGAGDNFDMVRPPVGSSF